MSLSHKIIKSHHTIPDTNRLTIETDILQVPLFSKVKEEPKDDSSVLEKEKGHLYLMEAQRKADALIEKAETELVQLKKAAQQEGYEAGKQQGYQEGYTNGYQEAVKKGQQESTELKQSAAHMLLEAEEKTKQYYIEKKDEWLELAAAMAENIVHETIDASSKKILTLIDPVIQRLKREDQLVILTVGPEQAEFVKENIRAMEQQYQGTRFTVLIDKTLEKNGCTIETTHSITDLQVSRQLNNMLEDMKKMG